MLAFRSVALHFSLVVALSAINPATAAKLKDPLSPLTSAKGSILCFRRDYSPSFRRST